MDSIVNSDLFTFIVGISGIVSAIAAVIAVCKINTVIEKQDSNSIKNQNQNIQGNGNYQAGRDIK